MAKLVHGSQSDEGDSIQLAWDDEQIAEWFNRQVDRDGAGNLPSDAPLGVAGYRVDVRRQGDQDWNSLVRVESRGDLSLGPHQLGAFAGESVVEAIPIQVSNRRPSEYWMPSYFCSWRGSSLVLIDEDYRRLHEHPDLQTPEAAPLLLNRDQLFRPIGDKAMPLLRHNLRFRVTSPFTRGGPASVRRPSAGHSVTTIPFSAAGQAGFRSRSPVGRRAAVTIAKPRQLRSCSLPACRSPRSKRIWRRVRLIRIPTEEGSRAERPDRRFDQSRFASTCARWTATWRCSCRSTRRPAASMAG